MLENLIIMEMESLSVSLSETYITALFTQTRYSWMICNTKNALQLLLNIFAHNKIQTNWACCVYRCTHTHYNFCSV